MDDENRSHQSSSKDFLVLSAIVLGAIAIAAIVMKALDAFS